MIDKKKKELLRKRGLSWIIKEIENLDKFFMVCYLYLILLMIFGKWVCIWVWLIIIDDL